MDAHAVTFTPQTPASPALGHRDPAPDSDAPADGSSLAYVMAGGAALMVAATRQGGSRWLLALLGGGLIAKGVSALDASPDASVAVPEPLDLQRTLSVCTTPEQAYAAWRDPVVVQKFFRHVSAIETLDANRWRWRIQPLDAAPSVAWEMMLQEDVPGRSLRFISTPDAPLCASVAVTFRPMPNSPVTEVQLHVSYAPGSHAASLLAHVLRPGLAHQVKEDLRRYKQLLETGEMATVEGQPAGQRSALHPLMKRVMA